MLEVVEKVCEHVVMIHKGRIVADESVSQLRELMHLPNLEEIFRQLMQQDDMESRAREVVAVMAR